MNLIAQLGFAFALFCAVPAFACPHSLQQFICPGDSVVDPDGNNGTVVAVNPFQKTAAVNIQNYINENVAISRLALAQGCLEGVCVGDAVVDPDGNNGTIVAVNPYSNQVVVNIQNYINEYAAVSNVAQGKGCILGYCVGDMVVDADGNAGTIVAVNPYTTQAVVNIQNYINEYSAINNLSSSKFCEDYGDSVRQMKRYPLPPIKSYLAPNFHYHAHR